MDGGRNVVYFKEIGDKFEASEIEVRIPRRAQLLNRGK